MKFHAHDARYFGSPEINFGDAGQRLRRGIKRGRDIVMLSEKRQLRRVLPQSGDGQQERARQQQCEQQRRWARRCAEKGHRFDFLWELPRVSLYRIAAGHEALPDVLASNAAMASAARSTAPAGPSLRRTPANSRRMEAEAAGSRSRRNTWAATLSAVKYFW